MDQVLKNQLKAALVEINEQIQTVKDAARAMEVSVYEMRYSDGRYVLSDLLLARAQILNGLAHISIRKGGK